MSSAFERKADFRLKPAVYFREASKQVNQEVVQRIPHLL